MPMSRKRTYSGAMVPKQAFIPLRPKRYMKRSKVRGSMTAAIRAAVTRLAERKVTIVHQENFGMVCAINSVPTGISLCPALSQGTAHNQRIGNQIRVVRATIKGHVTVLPVNATSNISGIVPTIVRLMVCRYKLANVSSLASTDVATKLFDTGGGTAGCQGSLFDATAFVNEDSWELVADKILKIGASSVSGNSATTGIPAANAYAFDNSSAILPFSFEFGSKLGNVIYNDTTTTASNKNLFLILQPVYASGATVASAIPCEFNYNYKCEYTDI